MNCENCGKKHDGNYGSGRFCSSECARGFSTKNRRKEINEKISQSLSKNPYEKNCLQCQHPFKTKKKKQFFCSVKCAHEYKIKNPEFIKKLSLSLSSVYKDSDKRNRLREIGRKGGFGKKGFTKGGIRYESLLEKKAFEYLEEKNIKFEAHKNIPNSSKVSDIYLPERDLWIELDGINREKRKKWLGKDYQYWLNKLEIYKNNNFNYRIIYNFEELKIILVG